MGEVTMSKLLAAVPHWAVPTKGDWRHTPSIKYRVFHCCGDWYKRDQFLDWAARDGEPLGRALRPQGGRINNSVGTVPLLGR